MIEITPEIIEALTKFSTVSVHWLLRLALMPQLYMIIQQKSVSNVNFGLVLFSACAFAGEISAKQGVVTFSDIISLFPFVAYVLIALLFSVKNAAGSKFYKKALIMDGAFVAYVLFVLLWTKKASVDPQMDVFGEIFFPLIFSALPASIVLQIKLFRSIEGISVWTLAVYIALFTVQLLPVLIPTMFAGLFGLLVFVVYSMWNGLPGLALSVSGVYIYNYYSVDHPEDLVTEKHEMTSILPLYHCHIEQPQQSCRYFV